MKANLFQNHPNYGGQFLSPDSKTKVVIKQGNIQNTCMI
jgi:hypothetical protein